MPHLSSGSSHSVAARHSHAPSMEVIYRLEFISSGSKLRAFTAGTARGLLAQEDGSSHWCVLACSPVYLAVIVVHTLPHRKQSVMAWAITLGALVSILQLTHSVCNALALLQRWHCQYSPTDTFSLHCSGSSSKMAHMLSQAVAELLYLLCRRRND